MNFINIFVPGRVSIIGELSDFVIVETINGTEFARVTVANKEMPEENLVSPLKPIVRKANEKDIKHNKENKRKEKEAFETAQDLIKQHKLDMNLTEVEYTFDNSKLLFYRHIVL